MKKKQDDLQNCSPGEGAGNIQPREKTVCKRQHFPCDVLAYFMSIISKRYISNLVIQKVIYI